MAKIVHEPQKPLPFAEFVGGRWVWLRPFLAVEWLTQWAAYLLGRWALLELLEYVGSFSVLAAVVLYFAGAHDRLEQKHYQAWQVINIAQGKGGNGGRIDAMQELNADGISLAGVDVSDAFLQRVRLPSADLRRSDLSGCDLREADFSNSDLDNAVIKWANFRNANLSGANLAGADLNNADMVGASLAGARVEGMHLANADLGDVDISGINGWQSIAEITGANIAGIKNPPDGFLAWAIAHGASQAPTTEP